MLVAAGPARESDRAGYAGEKRHLRLRRRRWGKDPHADQPLFRTGQPAGRTGDHRPAEERRSARRESVSAG